ncbi:MAG: BamA/TamA family outer membrane protein [Gemmatimonadota bacterium]
MGLIRYRSYTIALLATLVVALGPFAATADAQYFGRNQVQYNSFKFKVLKTEHFDIYYYPAEEEAIKIAARMAERWYERLSRLLDHEFDEPQPLIMYASHPDFEQTTAVGGQFDESTGGVTEALKRRIVLPFAGPLEDTDHVIGHELVHAFQFDITTHSSSAIGGSFPTALALPLWFVEGMAEYLSLGPVDPHTVMWMRDAAQREEFPNLVQLNDPRRYFPYRYGQAFWAYVAGRWGDQAIGEILKQAGRVVDPYYALEQVLAIPVDSLSIQWRRANEAAYLEIAETTQKPEDYGPALVTCCKGSGGRLNIAPVLSPDGKQVAFLSEKDLFAIEMFLADAETGEITRKILKTAVDPHFESLQYIKSSGTWHPDGREFAFGAVTKGTAIITIIDVERGKRDRDYKVREVGEIFNPSWSPDGRRIVFSAIRGGLSDLFMLDVETGIVEQMTNDAYAALQPAWSPDGKKIAFVTDRFSTDLSDLAIGNMRLALIDPETSQIEPIRGFSEGKHINPQWSHDGSSLFFLSDANGISNVYRVEVESGRMFQVTNLLVGVSGITYLSPAMSVDGPDDRIVYSAYHADTYTLWKIEDPEVKRGEPLDAALRRVSSGVLPPADRPVGDVMALLDNPTLGLPPSSDDFEEASYKAGLSLDYIAPPQLAVGSDRFGTFVGGGTALFWSDILGRRNLTTVLQVNGSIQDIAAIVGYSNRRSRWNWGVTAGQIPFVTFGLGGRVVETEDGELVLEETKVTFRQISREISAIVAYPFNRVHRMEFSGRFRSIIFDSSIETKFTNQFGETVDDPRSGKEDLPACSAVNSEMFFTRLCDPETLHLGTATASLVYDNAFFGGNGAILGQRYRLEAAPTIGTLNFVGALADYRRYFLPVLPYTIAARFMHFGRYGADSEDPRLTPLFTGYQSLIRGYNSSSFSTIECARPINNSSFVGLNSACPAFDQLFGSRMLVGNFELRFPLFQGFRLRHPAGVPPIQIALFFDAGVAWWSGPRALAVGGNRDPLNPVTSFGTTMRLNLFGAAIFQIDFVHPNNRPGQGWYFEFGLNPAF